MGPGELKGRITACRSRTERSLSRRARCTRLLKVVPAPSSERDVGTLATTALAIAQGADLIRVHDVGLNAQVARMADAIVRRPTLAKKNSAYSADGTVQG